MLPMRNVLVFIAVLLTTTGPAVDLSRRDIPGRRAGCAIGSRKRC